MHRCAYFRRAAAMLHVSINTRQSFCGYSRCDKEKQHVSPKDCFILINLNGVICQKNGSYVITRVATPNIGYILTSHKNSSLPFVKHHHRHCSTTVQLATSTTATGVPFVISVNCFPSVCLVTKRKQGFNGSSQESYTGKNHQQHTAASTQPHCKTLIQNAHGEKG